MGNSSFTYREIRVDMKRLLFIFNPFSGKAQVKDQVFNIVDAFTKEGFLVTVYPTQKRMDCNEYIKAHGQEYDMIVCSGGDGTLNETVSGILDNPECDVPIGYIPSGSTNDFATSLMIPKTVGAAVRHIIDGKEFLCDVGSFNGRWFNYVAAFGLFTDVSYATPQALKNALGHQAYMLEGVKSFANSKPYDLKVIHDGIEEENRYIYGMVANSISVGGMKNIAGKDVILDDGLFEVILIKSPKTPAEFQNMINGFIFQEDNSMVTRIKCSEITFTSSEPVPWVLDGEFGGDQTEVNIVIHKQKVRYITSFT